MPATGCFDYPADLPPVIGNCDAAQSVPSRLHRMVNTACFSY